MGLCLGINSKGIKSAPKKLGQSYMQGDRLTFISEIAQTSELISLLALIIGDELSEQIYMAASICSEVFTNKLPPVQVLRKA